MTDLRFSPKLLYISKHKNKALEQGSHTVWKQCQYYERIFKNAVIYFNLEVYCRKLQDLDFKEIGLKTSGSTPHFFSTEKHLQSVGNFTNTEMYVLRLWKSYLQTGASVCQVLKPKEHRRAKASLASSHLPVSGPSFPKGAFSDSLYLIVMVWTYLSPKGSSEGLVTEGRHHWEEQGLMEEAVWLVASFSALCLRHCQVKSRAASTKLSPDKMLFPKARGPCNCRLDLLKQEAKVKPILLLMGTGHRNSLGSSRWKDHKEKCPVSFLAKCLKCPWVCGQSSPCHRLEDARSGVWYFQSIPFLETILKTRQKLYDLSTWKDLDSSSHVPPPSLQTHTHHCKALLTSRQWSSGLKLPTYKSILYLLNSPSVVPKFIL